MHVGVGVGVGQGDAALFRGFSLGSILGQREKTDCIVFLTLLLLSNFFAVMKQICSFHERPESDKFFISNKIKRLNP